jgi:pectate lyase
VRSNALLLDYGRHGLSRLAQGLNLLHPVIGELTLASELHALDPWLWQYHPSDVLAGRTWLFGSRRQQVRIAACRRVASEGPVRRLTLPHNFQTFLKVSPHDLLAQRTVEVSEVHSAKRFALSFVALFLAVSARAGQWPLETIDAAPVGYGQRTVGWTESSTRCEVANLNDFGPGSLRDCVSTDNPKGVVFGEGGRGTIRLKSPLVVHSNTTIDGRGPTPVTLTAVEHQVMLIRDAENVIVNDLKFAVIAVSGKCKTPRTSLDTIGCGGGIRIDGSSKRIWIHQNLFEKCGGKCIQIWTKRSTPKGGDLVTISNNIIRNSFYGVLMGANHHLADSQIPLMRATVYRNYFYNIQRRSPRASELSHMHVLNNVVEDWGGNSCDDEKHEAFGASSVSGAQMLLENNYFSARASARACKTAVHIDDGFVKAVGNVSENGAIIRQNLPKLVFNPKAPAAEYYAYVANKMTNALRAQIISAAGPRWGGSVTQIARHAPNSSPN